MKYLAITITKTYIEPHIISTNDEERLYNVLENVVCQLVLMFKQTDYGDLIPMPCIINGKKSERNSHYIQLSMYNG